MLSHQFCPTYTHPAEHMLSHTLQTEYILLCVVLWLLLQRLLPGVYRCRQVFPGVHKCTPVLPGVYKCRQVFPGVHNCTQVLPGVCK